MFTVYAVDRATHFHDFRAGDRLLLNRLQRQPEPDDYIIFEAGGDVLARVEAVGGDTITVNGQAYAIPTRCPWRCDCARCALCWVDCGGTHRLIPASAIRGKAHRLFNLSFKGRPL